MITLWIWVFSPRKNRNEHRSINTTNWYGYQFVLFFFCRVMKFINLFIGLPYFVQNFLFWRCALLLIIYIHIVCVFRVERPKPKSKRQMSMSSYRPINTKHTHTNNDNDEESKRRKPILWSMFFAVFWLRSSPLFIKLLKVFIVFVILILFYFHLWANDEKNNSTTHTQRGVRLSLTIGKCLLSSAFFLMYNL